MFVTLSRVSPGVNAILLSLAILGIFVAISAVFVPNFFEPVNLANIARLYAPSGIMAIGLAVVLLSGEIDVSVGAIASVSVMTATTLVDTNEFLAIGAALLVGAVCGCINGVIVTRVRVPSLIVTIATLSVFGGLAAVVNSQTKFFEDKYPIYSLPSTANVFGLPASFLLCVLIAAVLTWVTVGTSFGRQIYFTGANRRAAWMSGVPVNRVRIVAFMISGVCAATAGYLLSAQIGNAAVDIGTGQELTAIAIAVLSGVSLFGGRGSIAAVLIGTMTLGVFINMLALFRLGSNFSLAMQGILVVAVVLLFGIVTRRSTRDDNS